MVVIGAGTAGRAVACATARGGYRTILEDILPATLRRAEVEMRARLNEDAQALTRVEYEVTVDVAARQADLVIEAVPDELESKLEIFTLLDKVCRPHTILAMSSSTYSVTEVASVTYRPGKCIGMRFLNAAGRSGLELVRGQQTTQDTVDACEEAGKRMGKQVTIMNC